MPYLQPATANYFGFMPSEGMQARTRIYPVSSTEATTINIGDIVVFTTDKNTVRALASRTDGGYMMGVAASRVVAGEGSTNADMRTVSSQVALVYDDPDQLFVGCDTTSGVAGVATLIGKSVQVCATGVVGSTGPNGVLQRSVMAISAVTVSSGSANTYKFRVIGLHPVETAYSTAAADTAIGGTPSQVRKWILKPDFHVLGFNGLGAGHVTT